MAYYIAHAIFELFCEGYPHDISLSLYHFMPFWKYHTRNIETLCDFFQSFLLVAKIMLNLSICLIFFSLNYFILFNTHKATFHIWFFIRILDTFCQYSTMHFKFWAISVGERGANEAPGQKRPLLRFVITAQGCKGVAGYCLCLVRATFSALTCSMKHGS